MKKRVLLLMALSTGVSVFAQDFIYTPTTKLKVTGDNIVANGNFTDLTKNWFSFSEDGKTLGQNIDMSKWGIVEKANGASNALVSNNAAQMNAYQTMELGVGIYAISYDIKAESEATSATNLGGSNTISIFINKDGSISSTSAGYRLLNSNVNITTDWKTITDTLHVDEKAANQLQVVFQNLTEGTQITNLTVRKVSETFDERVLERKINTYKPLFESPEWAKANKSGERNEEPGKEFGEILEQAEGAYAQVKGGEEMSTTDGEALMAAMDENFKAFLDANAADMSEYYKGWEGTGKRQKTGSAGDWKLEGGRWFHMNGAADKDNEIYATIQGSLALPSSKATLTTTFTPGRYLYVIDMKGTHMAGQTKALYYNVNLDSPMNGVTIFANDQTIDVGTLPTRWFNTYNVFFDAGEGDKNITIGANYDLSADGDFADKKLGGTFTIANAKLYKLGTTEQEQTRLYAINQVINANNALRVMADSAQAIIKNNVPAEYPWGLDVLKDSVQFGEEAYLKGIAVVGADRKVVDEEGLKNNEGKYIKNPQIVADMNAAMKNLQAAISAYNELNKPYRNLVALKAEAEQVAADASVKGTAGTKKVLQEKIAEADNMIKGVTSEAAVDAFNALYAELSKALQAYKNSAASFDKPSDVAIVNPNFDGNVKGWTFTETIKNKEGFKVENEATFDAGHYAHVWRGYTVSPQSKLVQTITLTEPGIYEYRAKAIASNDNRANGVNAATIVTDDATGVSDTSYVNSKVRLFFGPDGAPDSTGVYSRNLSWNPSAGRDAQQVNGYQASPFSVYMVKTDDTPVTVELGLSAYGQVDAAGFNSYGFGDNKVFFYGEPADYYKALAAQVKKTADDAETQLNASTSANASLLEEGRVYLVNRLKKAIAEAQAVTTTKDSKSAAKAANAMWAVQTYLKALDTVATGIQGVYEVENNAVKTTVKGVYNLAGVKVADSLDAVPAGLYIVNGKKVIK